MLCASCAVVFKNLEHELETFELAYLLCANESSMDTCLYNAIQNQQPLLVATLLAHGADEGIDYEDSPAKQLAGKMMDDEPFNVAKQIIYYLTREKPKDILRKMPGLIIQIANLRKEEALKLATNFS